MTRSAAFAAFALALGALGCSGVPTPGGGILPPPDDVPAIPSYIATVATNHFADGPTLERAEADADAIERAFIERLQFKEDRGNRLRLRLRDDVATTAAIRQLIGPGGPLDELPQRSMVVLYIALHGKAESCNKDELCGRLWARDTTTAYEALAVEELLREVAANGPDHIIVLLDTCYGGLALRAKLEPLDYQQLISDRPSRRRSRKVLSSAGPGQLADDGNSTRPGRFADVLLDALDGDADLLADGRLTFTELALFAQAEVRRRSARAQEPEFGGFGNDGRGEPLLGGLRLPLVEGGDDAALLDETLQSIDRAEYREAQRQLARLMQARRHRALLARRRLQDARLLADTGEGEQAVALLGQQAQEQEVLLGVDHPAVAVTRLLRVELAQQADLPAEQVTRFRDEAAISSRAVGRAAQTPNGQMMTADALGGLALATDAPEVAADMAAEARTRGKGSVQVGVLAANEAVGAAVAGDHGRADVARGKAREAGVEVSLPMSYQGVNERLRQMNRRLDQGDKLRKADVDFLAQIDRTSPGYYEANRLLAEFYFQLKDYKRQSNALEEATRRGPYKHEPAILLSLAKAYAQQRNYGKALKALRRVERKMRRLPSDQKADVYRFFAEMLEFEFLRQYYDDPKRAEVHLIDQAIFKWERYRTLIQSDPGEVSKANQKIVKLSGLKREMEL